MAYFEFENSPSEETPLSAENLNEMQNLIKEDVDNVSQKTNKNIMTRSFPRQNVTVNKSWGATKIRFDNVNSIGNKLTSDTNGVKIGREVSKVLVSAQCAGVGTNTTAGDKQFIIKKRY